MNFSLQQPEGTTPPTPTPTPPTQGLPPRRRGGRRRRTGLKTPLRLTALVAGAAAVSYTSVPGLGKSVTGLFSSTDTSIIKYKVTRTKLPVTVVERGSLESSKNLDAINEVEGMTTIISIVPEGKYVKKDEQVCVLDSATLRDNLVNQEIATKRAKADYDQTVKTLEVAKIAVDEYLLGTFPSDKQTAEGSIKLAESDLIKAQDRLEWSNRMTKIGYVAASQNQSDKLAKDKAQYTLEQSQRQLLVLMKFTKTKQMTELQANVEKATSDMLAKKQTFELEKTKEEKLKKQISKTILYAPNDGLVVYANDTGRFGGSNQPMIEEGAQVRERQKIFSLPDINRMRVNTKVHESMIKNITTGLSARIRVDAFPNQPLTGTVESYQPLPDPSSFFNSDVKVYTTLVAIQNGHGGLRPGMTAQVEILVTQLDDVLTVPIQSILEFKHKDHVYVITPDGPKRREIKVGISNEKFVEVKEGIKEGEYVAMNPTSLMTEAEKREAFSSGAKDGDQKDWSADDVKAGVSPGALAPDGPPDAAKKKGGARRKGAGGGMAVFQKIRTLTAKLTPEEQEKVNDRSVPIEEKEELYKKAGVTDEDIAAMKAAIQQMMQNGGGFGGGGPGGGGGPRGGGGPGGGGGQGGGQSE
jgi:RND family efflux transporter MFP subunit